MSIRKRYTSDELSSEELEKLTVTLLEAKFDQSSKQDFRRELAEKHGINRPTPKPRAYMRWVTWASVAAAVVLILFFGIFKLSPANDYLKLTESYLAVHFPNNLEDRKGTTDEDVLRSQAIEAYGQQDFAQSAVLREQLTQLPQAKVEDHFYLALSYLYQTPPKRQLAIQKLEQLERARTDYTREARWYLALALISDGQTDQARTYLETIINTDGWNTGQAAKILALLPK